MDYSETNALSGRQQAIVGRVHHTPTQFTKAVFAVSFTSGRKKQRAGTIVEVLFDSSLQSNLDGVRSAGKQTRQMLFRAGPYQVDVKIDVIPDTVRLSITGQLLDVTLPEMVAPETQVTLSNRRGNRVHTLTNEFGEFRAEIEKSDDLEIILRDQGGKPIAISLRNPLG